MNSYDERMAAIESADNARRADRELSEMLAYYGQSVTDSYHVSRQITGQPSPNNRNHKASQDSWTRGLTGRAFGHVVIDGEFVKTDAVKITKNGKTTYGRVSRNRKSDATIVKNSKAKRDITLMQGMGTIHETDS